MILQRLDRTPPWSAQDSTRSALHFVVGIADDVLARHLDRAKRQGADVFGAQAVVSACNLGGLDLARRRKARLTIINPRDPRTTVLYAYTWAATPGRYVIAPLNLVQIRPDLSAHDIAMLLRTGEIDLRPLLHELAVDDAAIDDPARPSSYHLAFVPVTV